MHIVHPVFKFLMLHDWDYCIFCDQVQFETVYSFIRTQQCLDTEVNNCKYDRITEGKKNNLVSKTIIIHLYSKNLDTFLGRMTTVARVTFRYLFLWYLMTSLQRLISEKNSLPHFIFLYPDYFLTSPWVAERLTTWFYKYTSMYYMVPLTQKFTFQLNKTVWTPNTGRLHLPLSVCALPQFQGNLAALSSILYIKISKAKQENRFRKHKGRSCPL